MSRSVRRRASWWLIRLQGEDVTAADRVRFWAWLAADPRHAAAFERVAKALGDMGALSEALRDYRPVEAPPRSPPIALVGTGVALAASAAFALIWLSAPRQYETEIGEQRDLALADGSVVELNTDTRIDVHFSGAARRVRMDHGEALFRVAHEPGRPFEVEAGGQSVRAIGTEFVVRVSPGALNVIVTEGVVEIDRAHVAQAHAVKGARADPFRLVAQQRFILSGQNSALVDLTPSELKRSLDWRDGMLSFNGEPLGAVAEEVARYTGARFIFDDPDVEGMRVVGHVRATDLGGFLEVLRRNFPDLVVRRMGGEVRIGRSVIESECPERAFDAGAGIGACR